jgi:hypothetical protein
MYLQQQQRHIIHQNDTRKFERMITQNVINNKNSKKTIQNVPGTKDANDREQELVSSWWHTKACSQFVDSHKQFC